VHQFSESDAVSLPLFFFLCLQPAVLSRTLPIDLTGCTEDVPDTDQASAGGWGYIIVTPLTVTLQKRERAYRLKRQGVILQEPKKGEEVQAR